MSSITCGKCKATGQTVAHVRECYAGTATAPTVTTVPTAPVASVRPVADIPQGYYAVQASPALVLFYRVSQGKAGTRWEGYTFLDRVHGAPGDFRKEAIRGVSARSTLARIASDTEGAAALFGRAHGVCGLCSSPLTDPESIARGIGPVCAAKL
jgi:hypothetical protein